MQEVDPSKVASDGYPLTMVIYAAVNLTSSKAASRTAISKMINYMAGAGQVQGKNTGAEDEYLGLPYAAPPVGALRAPTDQELPTVSLPNISDIHSTH